MRKKKGVDVKQLLLKELFLIQTHFVWYQFQQASTGREECAAHLEGSAVAAGPMPPF